VLLVNSTKAWPDKDNPPYESCGQGPGVFEPAARVQGTSKRKQNFGRKQKGLNKAESGDAQASPKTFTKEALRNVEPEYILDICSGYQSCAKYYLQAFPRCKVISIDIMLRGKALSRINPAYRSRIKYHKFDVDKLTIEELQRILWEVVGHNDWAADTLPLVANVLDYDFR
jgi:hypothetical protein